MLILNGSADYLLSLSCLHGKGHKRTQRTQMDKRMKLRPDNFVSFLVSLDPQVLSSCNNKAPWRRRRIPRFLSVMIMSCHLPNLVWVAFWSCRQSEERKKTSRENERRKDRQTHERVFFLNNFDGNDLFKKKKQQLRNWEETCRDKHHSSLSPLCWRVFRS